MFYDRQLAPEIERHVIRLRYWIYSDEPVGQHTTVIGQDVKTGADVYYAKESNEVFAVNQLYPSRVALLQAIDAEVSPRIARDIQLANLAAQHLPWLTLQIKGRSITAEG